jgi:hypothetical protein
MLPTEDFRKHSYSEEAKRFPAATVSDVKQISDILNVSG